MSLILRRTDVLLSDSCRPDGDAHCDGFVGEGEDYEHDICDCFCHTLWDPLETTEEYREIHAADQHEDWKRENA